MRHDSSGPTSQTIHRIYACDIDGNTRAYDGLRSDESGNIRAGDGYDGAHIT